MAQRIESEIAQSQVGSSGLQDAQLIARQQKDLASAQRVLTEFKK